MGGDAPCGTLFQGDGRTISPEATVSNWSSFPRMTSLHLQVEAAPSLQTAQTTSASWPQYPIEEGWGLVYSPGGGLQLALPFFFSPQIGFSFLSGIYSIFPSLHCPFPGQIPLHSCSEGECVKIPCILTWDVSFNKHVLNSYFVSLRYHSLVFPPQNDLEACRIFLSFWPEVKDGTTVHGCFDHVGGFLCQQHYELIFFRRGKMLDSRKSFPPSHLTPRGVVPFVSG